MARQPVRPALEGSKTRLAAVLDDSGCVRPGAGMAGDEAVHRRAGAVAPAPGERRPGLVPVRAEEGGEPGRAHVAPDGIDMGEACGAGAREASRAPAVRQRAAGGPKRELPLAVHHDVENGALV